MNHPPYPVRRFTYRRRQARANKVEANWNVMAHAQKPDCVFRRNGRVLLNRRVRQISRLLAAELCASAVVMLDTPCSEVVWRVLATHFIYQFPLHFPSRVSPCAITFQLKSTKGWSCTLGSLSPMLRKKCLHFQGSGRTFFDRSKPTVGCSANGRRRWRRRRRKEKEVWYRIRCIRVVGKYQYETSHRLPRDDEKNHANNSGWPILDHDC